MEKTLTKTKRHAWVWICFLLCMALTVNAQPHQKLITVSFKDKALVEILDFISSHGDRQVNYEDEVKTFDGKYTVSFEDATAEKAVQALLQKTPFTYSVQGNVIKVFRLQNDAADSHQVQGTVYGSNGETIPMATIQLKGSKKGTVADANGVFSLMTPTESGYIVVSSLGYETQTVQFGPGKKELKIRLKDSSKTLGEVSVIAYGQRNTREVLGAISSVKSDKLQNMATPSIETLLQGRMSGVEVSNLSGSPGGGGTQVVIRGYSSLNNLGSNSSSPLFIIDGIPVESSTSEQTGGINPLSSLDPSTIESVDVLKDAASASLYGSRAGNGVILIKTKRGKSGNRDFSINVSQSISFLPATPVQTIGKGERELFMMLAKNMRVANFDYMTNKAVLPSGYNETWGWPADYGGAYDYLWRNGNVMSGEEALPAIVTDSLNSFYNNSTNWWKYAFRVGSVTKADLQASGGNDNVKYMVGAGVYNERGIMINSLFRRASFISNLDFKLTPKVDAWTRINLSYTNKNVGTSGAGARQGMTIDPKLTPSSYPGRGSEAERLAMQQIKDIKEKNSNYNIRLSAGFNYSIIKNLVLASSASVNHYRTDNNTFTPTYLTSNNLSQVIASSIGVTSLQTENILTYRLNLKDIHNAEVMAGVTYNYDKLNTLGGQAQGGPTNSIHYVSDGWPNMRQNSEGTYEALQRFTTNFEEQAMLSYLGRVAYNYKRKYLMEASVRSDGSSVFGKDVRWATFPSVGLGWAFSEEPFMKKYWWLSFGKVRASWGQSGQKFKEAYLALGTLAESNTFMGTLGLIPSMMANSRLTWEKSDQIDLGLDLQMLDYRLKMKLDYYYKRSSALLLQIPLPGNFFFMKSVWNNASVISNEGLEFEINYDLIRKKDMSWNIGMNISRNWNMFREGYNGTDLPGKVLGRPIYGIYTYHDEGIVQSEEQIPYYYNQRGQRTPLSFGGENYPLRVGGRNIKDQNMDGKITVEDLYYAGSTIPLAYGGITTDFTWKGLSVSVLFSYMLNRKMMNMVKNAAFSFTKSYNVVMNNLNEFNYWKQPGDNTAYPALEFAEPSYVGQFDGDIDSNIESVSFLRLKQFTVSYNLPKGFYTKLGVKNVNVYFSGENLFLLTNYSGLDPEIVNPYTGKDIGDMYPLDRKMTIGLKIKF